MKKQILEIDAQNYAKQIIGDIDEKGPIKIYCYTKLSELWEKLYHKEGKAWKVCLWRYDAVKRELEEKHGIIL